MAAGTVSLEPNSWDVERRADGAVIVRVHSSTRDGRPLSDAAFTFRLGDPQYAYWEEQLCLRLSASESP